MPRVAWNVTVKRRRNCRKGRYGKTICKVKNTIIANADILCQSHAHMPGIVLRQRYGSSSPRLNGGPNVTSLPSLSFFILFLSEDRRTATDPVRIDSVLYFLLWSYLTSSGLTRVSLTGLDSKVGPSSVLRTKKFLRYFSLSLLGKSLL